jgi:hypothetical protein
MACWHRTEFHLCFNVRLAKTARGKILEGHAIFLKTHLPERDLGRRAISGVRCDRPATRQQFEVFL